MSPNLCAVKHTQDAKRSTSLGGRWRLKVLAARSRHIDSVRADVAFHAPRPLPPPSALLTPPAPAAVLRCGSMASDLAVDFAPFDALPEPVLRVIMLALPVDARAQAACVCRSWRAFLADASLWEVLDLTPAGGVAAERLTEDFVDGAAERAGRGMRVLRLIDVPALRPADLGELIVSIVEAHGAELRQLCTNACLNFAEVDSVCAAAPRLQEFYAGVAGTCDELIPVLRNDPPYGSLRVSVLQIDGVFAAHEAIVPDLAAAAASHEWLNRLLLSGADSARTVNALVDAAAQQSISWLELNECSLDAESVSALARLLQRGSLIEFNVDCDGFPHAQEALLCAALRTCSPLKYLRIALNPEGGANRRTVAELLDAAAALPALEVLSLDDSVFEDRAAAGHALGALLRANLPNLRSLHLEGCLLEDDGMEPLLDGLEANTHLRQLACGRHIEGLSYRVFVRLARAMARVLARPR